MLDQKKTEESVKRAKIFLRNGTIRKDGAKEFVKFHLSKAKDSLDQAESSIEHTEKGDFNGSLWAVNASYYSMFFTVRALLEDAGIKLGKNVSTHLLAFDALVYFFYETKKLEKKFCEQFAEAQEESFELLGKQAADDLVYNYFSEKNKRATFTYEDGVKAMLSKAKTSYKRAVKFNADLRTMIKE